MVSPMDTRPLISLAREALSPTAQELLSTPGTPPAMLVPPHLASPILLARGAPSPMEPELPSTLATPPAMLVQPPTVCPIFSMAREAPKLMLMPMDYTMVFPTMDQLTPSSTSTERGVLMLILILTMDSMAMALAMAILTLMVMASPTGTA